MYMMEWRDGSYIPNGNNRYMLLIFDILKGHLFLQFFEPQAQQLVLVEPIDMKQMTPIMYSQEVLYTIDHVTKHIHVHVRAKLILHDIALTDSLH